MKLRVLLAVPLIVCCYSTFGSAGPAEDLASGRQALEKGELDRAVALLASVAEALPDSVEAQLALGDCYLQLGQLKEALASYREVLELEPNHARAKRIVAALTAQKVKFSDRLTGVRTLMKLRAYASAEELLQKHPQSNYISSAVQRIEQITVTYARLDRWPVSRDVIKQNEAAFSNRPGRAKLLQAATYLGELEATRGLALLGFQDAPKSDAPRTAHQRQDDTVDQAYAMLIDLVKDDGSTESGISRQARSEVFWLMDFFESTGRADRANVLIARFLADRPQDFERVALEFRATSNQLDWAGRPAERVGRGLAWLKPRDLLFQNGRQAIAEFIQKHPGARDFVNRAHLLIATSYERQSTLTAPIDPVRAGGLLVQSAKTLLKIHRAAVDHPEVGQFPDRLWQLADRLAQLGQADQAIQVLEMIQVQFSYNALASKSVLRIAELHARDLTNSLKAVETFQVYLSMSDDVATVSSRIFEIADRLATEKRYLESMHVHKVFVESFPDDNRVPEALTAVGRFHQINEDWLKAISTYARIADEYPQATALPRANLAIAECRIHLGEWNAARQVYERYLGATSNGAEANVARSRIEVLKQLERYETLLAGDAKNPNNDDARFQIGRLVLERLNNPARAVLEFRRVTKDFPNSEYTDDSRLETGRALLTLNQLDAAREALLEVPTHHRGSPLADDALLLAGESYENQARKLANTSAELMRAESFTSGQREALLKFTAHTEEKVNDGDPAVASLDAAFRASLISGATADRLFCQVCAAESRSE
ncbi:MAG: tetratricopeptide repeat protein, partial [Planctomycetes bacterium]|nr:tetratricopeptide repeat protein [Planctomycetota bacterium]